MTDGAELILSKSAIDVFLRCGYQWLLGYAMRIKGAPTLDMAVGTAVHAGVEAHWNGDDPREATRTALAREVALMPAPPPDTVAGAVRDAHAMTGTYLAHIAPTFTPTMVETDFLIRIDGTLVSGRIDCADGDVHDTKTTSTPSKVDPEHHRLGMTIYRWGYKALTGHLPGRLLLDVVARNLRWKIVEVTPNDQEMADVVGVVASAINKGDFQPTGALSGRCPYCPYARLCSYSTVR